MRRHSEVGGRPTKMRSRKTATLRRRPTQTKAASSRRSAAAAQETEIARLSRERDEALEREKASAEVLRIISSSPGELEPVFQAMLAKSVRICDAKFGNLWVREGEKFRLVAICGGSQKYRDYMFAEPLVSFDPRSAMGRIVETGKVVNIDDFRKAPSYGMRNRIAMVEIAKARSFVAVPMLKEGKVVGLITIYRQERRAFADALIALVESFAAQAVIAIENARLMNELRQRTDELSQRTDDFSEALEQQTATSEVLRVISSSPGELQPVFDAMLANATRLCDAKFASLRLSEADQFRTVSLYNAPAALVEHWRSVPLVRPHPESALARMVLTRQVTQIDDVRTSPAYRKGDPLSIAATDLGGYRTVLAVPMLKRDSLIGAITIYRQEVRPFTSKQIELVQNFAAQAVIAIENARLLNELRESLQQQTATSGVLQVISGSPGELEPVFDAILENVTRICDAPFAGFFRFESGMARLATQLGLPTKFAEFLQREGNRPGPNHPFSRMVRTKKTVHVPDYLADEAYLGRDPMAVAGVEIGGIRTLLAVPMLKDEELIGFIGTFRQETNPFTDKEIALVTNFSAQAVIAIENARLLNELRESLDQQTATSEVLSVISSSPGKLEPVFQAMLANAARICEAKFGTLYSFADGKFHLAAQFGSTPDLIEAQKARGPFKPTPGTLLERVMCTKQVAHTADYANEPGQSLPARLGGARSTVTVPMLKEGQLVGVFAIYRQEPRPFTSKQIELVKNFAAQAVIAIENARLLSELRESLEQQTATSEVLKVISGSPGDLEPVFSAILENATRICRAQFGILFSYDGQLICKTAVRNVPVPLLEFLDRRGPFTPTAGTALAEAIDTGRVAYRVDVSIEEAQSAPARLGGAKSLMSVPIFKDEVLVGAISVYRQEVRPFTEKQIELVQNFAAQAVIAIENTRLLNELRESLQQQTATSDVLKVISSSPGELGPVFEALLENAVHVCGAKFGNLWLREGELFRAVAVHGAPAAYRETLLSAAIHPGPDTGLGVLLKTKRFVQIDDITKGKAYLDRDPLRVATVELGGGRTLAEVPLLKDGELIGSINIYHQEVKPFTEKQIELLTNFASQAVIAIENARLLNELRQRTGDLSKSLNDLRTAQDRLVQTQKLASLGQLTAGIAHEIKNPLNFVNNFSGLSVELLDELQEAVETGTFDAKRRNEIAELTNTLRGNLDKIAQHGKRADAIVKNMLLHSREGSSEHRSVDINALVEDALNLAYHGARAEKQGFEIKLQRSFDPAAGEADIFPQDVTRVLLNLIANGFYAALKRKGQADGGFEPTITAATRSLGDRVEITIRDNGIGIAADVKEKMFNPFFTTKPTGEGTGLGLSISHDIVVKQHAGAIEVETEPGAFTAIRVILPRATAS
jgi:GAF domain-containing protein